MDELVRHCLRELSFDGDLGCDVSRLRDFVVDFYAHPGPSGGLRQNVDDAFCAFVWSVIVQQPGVRVGTVPDGVSTEVYIAPQASAVRKAKAKGEEAAEEAAPATALDVIPDATIRPLEDLKNEYGDRLRIAVDPDTSFAALTGSHIRPSKLTPMIYSGLQIITRGREQGVSVLDLGKKSGYDQKTCFYIIKQLVELGLVVKLRRPGVSTNLCVHKYFYERSPVWQQVAEEEKKAVSEEKEGDKEALSDDEIDQADETKPFEPVHFDPIDSRHLSSMPLLKSRLTKLLKNCPHYMHTSSNIMLKIGFVNPTRTDRRFFRTRLRELMEQGVIEKVQVPHADRKRFPDRKVQCIRLITEDARSQSQGEVVVDDDFEEVEAVHDDDYTGLKANVSLHRQMIDIVAEAGTKGMTLNQISAALGDFDRRTVDLLLNRLEKDPPPAHLADLGIAQLAESHGRERRYKYYTVAHYLALAEKEGFEDRRYRDVDMSSVGGFLPVDPSAFYEDEEQLTRHVNALTVTKREGPSKAKAKKRVNPILPDGSVKKGRPRKSVAADGTPASTAKGKKRKREDPAEGDQAGTQTAVASEGAEEPPPKKRRGRPPKQAQPPTGEAGSAAPTPSTSKRKRGRPSTHTADTNENEGDTASAVGPSSQIPVPKRRARASKKATGAAEEDVFGPAPGSGTVDAEPLNAVEASNPSRGPLQLNAAQSSPLSAVPTSPIRASSPTAGSMPADVDQLLAADALPSTLPATAASSADSASQAAALADHPETRSRFRSKGNISQSRRENELLRLLAEAGGIMNTSCKEFYEAHAALVETITRAGEVASTRPGTRIDKRTLEATLTALDTKGKVKIMTTMVPNPTGSTRSVRIVYLPETSSEALNAFLTNLSESVQPIYAPSLKTLEEPLAYGGAREKAQVKPRPSTSLKHTDDQAQLEARATELFARDDQAIREALLTEKNTVAQLYGYIVGKAARARALHMLTVDVLEKGSTSSQIVSPESRIVNFAYYYTDISLSAFCSLVSVTQPNDELGQLLQSPEGQAMPVEELPEGLRSALAPAQSRSRARLLSLLDMLRVLDLVTPLMPSDSPNPTITCIPASGHPATFDIAPPGPYTPSTAPMYWRFNDVAAIRLWALPNGLPPVWKVATLSTSEQTAAYWGDLERVSVDVAFAEGILGAVPPPSEDAPEDVTVVAKTLRRSISWSATYNLSWYQTEYLRRYIDPATGHTPLEDEDGGEAQLNRLSWVISASKDVIVNYFAKARKKHLRDLKKVETRIAKGKQKAGEDAGAVLARRAAEAKEQRERDWEEMLRRIHPGDLRQSAAQRIQRLKNKFMQGAGKPSEKWEGRIAEAIREADMVAEKLLPAQTSILPPMPVAKPVLPAPVVTATQEKDVDELIAAQGPRAEQEARIKKSKKGKEKDTGESGQTPRRHRFLWNRDYDELVRDASVIIKARCRGGTRLDWGALEQVFPAVPRNSVRQRLVHLKETPGTETYLSRLEDKWYELWVQHRGTDVLPDPDPESASNFDLATHVKFLRKHIDKNAIRVGFVEVQDGQKTVLPASVEELERIYDVVEKVPTAPPWDFMWSVVAEEGREKQFAQHAFTAEVGDMPPSNAYESEFIQVADAAVKMALGNPNETYDPEVASQLLKGVGEEPVRIATTELLNRGVLAKTVRDPAKSKPGRTLKISDNNLNALGGQLPREVFQDASALEELLSQQEEHTFQWQEWSLLASDGDTAFLIELASENKASASSRDTAVQFEVDTSHPRSMRAIIDWNSKKADDDDIETDIRVRYLDIAGPPPEPEPEPPAPELPAEPTGSVSPTTMQIDDALSYSQDEEHGRRAGGEPAFCRRVTEGLVDCQACLADAERTLLRELVEEERSVAEKILGVLRAAGSTGLTKQQIFIELEMFPAHAVRSVIQRMTDTAAAVPLAYWTGYAAVVLVAATHIRPWTVSVPDAEPRSEAEGEVDERTTKTMLFPRRWLDIYGRKLHDVWEAAMRAALSLVLLRPGISQAEIRWRLRSVYDRQEVCEVLQTLLEEGYITPRPDAAVVGPGLDLGPADDKEERATFWFLAAGGRRWYQV
ncbi:hypothetical protein OH77DRAFT_1396288 [Trametes cingulata]|nr:hypothetical protein OH77DRAFT_1396288 [Trametes cingulata]